MQLQLEVLGQFRVTLGDKTIPPEAWRRERSAALVKLLAVSPGHRLHREQIMNLFWPDLAPEAAGANLRKAVHFARKTLGEHDVIESSETISFASGIDVRVDSQVFEDAARAATRSAERAACERAAELYRGELLPDDRYVEWLDEPRMQLRQRLVRMLRAGKLWQRLIELDPTDEEAQCALMKAALDAGRRGEAIRLFQELRERLRVDLGIGPSKAAVALHDQALATPDVAPVGVVDRIRASLAWGMVHLHGGEMDKVVRIARECRELALGAGLGREMGEATALLGMTAHLQGQWPELFREEIVEWVRAKPAFTSSVFDGHLCLAEFCLASPGGRAQMVTVASELGALSERAASKPGSALAALIMGDLALCDGRLDDAERHLRAALQLHDDADATAGRVLARERLARLALLRGRHEAARTYVAEGAALAGSSWIASHLRIRLMALQVETATSLEQALDEVQKGDRVLATGTQCQPCSMGFRVAAANVLCGAGELDPVGRRLDEAERIAAMWNGGPWAAAIWESRGLLRRAQGNEARALAAFDEAASRYQELGRALDKRRCEDRMQPAQL
ncbi:MAG: BTAD domain-containing putative transcriptional regulator [Polyangiales bacterium]